MEPQRRDGPPQSLSSPPAHPLPGGARPPLWLQGRLEVAASGRELAARVADQLLKELRSGPGQPLGLATGRTMEPVYAALLERLWDLPQAERAAILDRWSSFNLDEYGGLARDDPRSFAAAMDRMLGRPLGLDPARLRLPDGLAADPAAEARRYGDAVARAGGIGLQLLGLGDNGHVGFNEPPCGPNAPTRWLSLNPATRRQNAGAFGGDPERVPEGAITLGLREILRARRVLLVVAGAAKRPILRRLLSSAPDADLPASWLQRHPDLRLMVDRAALEG